MQNVFKIEGKKVGIGQPAFIAAEIGLNHNGDPDLARQLIKAAADAGVDAVKFQIFKAETWGDLYLRQGKGNYRRCHSRA